MSQLFPAMVMSNNSCESVGVSQFHIWPTGYESNTQTLLKLCTLHYLMSIHNRTIYTWQQLLVITVSKENLLYNTIVVIVAPFNCGPPVIAFLPPSDHYVGCCPFHWLLMYTFIGILEKHDTIGRSYLIWSTILLYPSLGGGRFTRSPTPMCKTAPQGGIHNLLLRQHQCRYGQHS